MESYEHYCAICDRIEDHSSTDDDDDKACCVFLCEECYAMLPDDDSKPGIGFGF